MIEALEISRHPKWYQSYLLLGAQIVYSGSNV